MAIADADALDATIFGRDVISSQCDCEYPQEVDQTLVWILCSDVKRPVEEFKDLIYKVPDECLLLVPEEAKRCPFTMSKKEYISMGSSTGRRHVMASLAGQHKGPAPMVTLLCMLELKQSGTRVPFFLCTMEDLDPSYLLCVCCGEDIKRGPFPHQDCLSTTCRIRTTYAF